ncbi:acid-sensing ion channel 4-A isoform X1 [Amia ocellicauda]|uniref:acid-sensing ion channel 4-A isoform X1 n=1 Tax=Amia ocellicauda TaxID=2972642 RepID=UPI003463C9C9
MWIVAFIVCLSILIYHQVGVVSTYFTYPHVTKLEEITDGDKVFPAITFCNTNSVRFSQLQTCDFKALGFTESDLDFSILDEEDVKRLTALFSVEKIKYCRYCNYNWTEFYERTGPDLSSMMIHCTFENLKCKMEDFRVVYTRYGKCYTFNGQKSLLKKTKQGGMGNGLEIMLDIQQDDYLPIWKETNQTSLEAGLRVQIHSQDEPPYIHQLGFGVSPGFQTFVSCQEQRLTYLPQPWGNCRPNGDTLIPGYETYSISACRLKCEAEDVIKRCHCRMVHMPGNAKICTPNDIECVEEALSGFQKKTNDSCSCETPCNLTRYGKELSMVKIPSKGSARYLSKKFNKTEAYIRDNFLVLDIFFEALNYETIEQKKAYDVTGLLSDIGGQMGLFIGASILTILEILDYIYEVMKDRLQRLMKPQKDENKKQSGSIATLGLEDMKAQDTCEMIRSHPEGTYAATILPNHHHHPHHGVFEDFAC